MGMEPTALVDEAQEINLRVAQPMFRYVRQHFGESELERLVEGVGLPLSHLRRSAVWISHERFEAILLALRDLVSSDQEFMRACAHEMRKVYGPMLLVLRCMTVHTAYDAMASTLHLASKISRFEIVGRGRRSIRLRYTSERKESRLMCLSRQAVQRLGPSLWLGNAPGVLHERSCIAHGDDACVYDIRWYEPLRLRRALAGALVGGAAALAIPGALVDPLLAFGLLPLGGLMGGMFFEQRRMLADYVKFHDDSTLEFERIVQAHAKAVDEVLALHERERQWSQRLQSNLDNRSNRLEQVLHRLEDNQSQTDKLRTLSHDISNPLTVLAATAEHLKSSKKIDDPFDKESVGALESAVGQLSRLVGELFNIVRERPSEQKLEAAEIDVAAMTERIRRQLRATVMGRDVRVSVFQTRDAPEKIHSVPLLVDRILDNVLTNACKYTETGSIVAEVRGKDEHLELMLSDTGRGIDPARIEQVFLASGPDPVPPAVGTSHGDGMSIVIRLLDQLSGRLEIMSDPGVGTTLWVRIPREHKDDATDYISSEPLDVLRERIVTIRTRSGRRDKTS